MMDNKHKLIIISDSGLLQRHFDYLYVDNLNEAFDFEYWNCSKLLLKEEHRIKSQIERPYDITINSYWQLYRKLRRLPHDAMVLYFALWDSNANKVLFLLHSFFKQIVGIRVSMVIPNALGEQQQSKQDTIKSDSLTNKTSKRNIVKDYLYRSDIVKIGLKMLFHPNRASEIWNRYIRNFERHVMSCVPGARYKINATNFEKYMRSKGNVAERRFMVYVDQYFPYHKELGFDMSKDELDDFAQSHFSKLNRYFEKIEKKYNCPIVIAAHPLAQYTSNPYGGREIQYGATDKLISECEVVLQHQSGSFSYAILNNKPIALLSDNEFRQSIWNVGIENLHHNYGIDIIDIDLDNPQTEIKPLPAGLRERFVKECCGDVDEENFVFNDVLLVKHLNEIYNEINN